MVNEMRAADGYGLDSLTWPERVICGPLIKRQFERGPRVQRDLSKYGLLGTARLYSARAFQVFTLGFGLLGIPLAVAGQGAVAAAFFVLAMLNAGIGICRVVSGVRTGSKWRNEKSG
jgi:hypothetical protein